MDFKDKAIKVWDRTLELIFCAPARLTRQLNFKKGRGVYLMILLIVIAYLCYTLLQQTIAIPEPLCYYNDIKQLQNNQASINNLVINPDDQDGDDSAKIKKVYYDPVEHNPVTGQPDLNPNNARFSSYGSNCPGGDCSRRLNTLLSNPETAANLTKDEKKTTLIYNLAQLSNYYLPSFNIVNISKNKFVDYIQNIQSTGIMKNIYSISMTFMVIFGVIWIVYAARKLLWNFNFFGLDTFAANGGRERQRVNIVKMIVYVIVVIVIVATFFGLSVNYFKNDLDKEENPEEKTTGNFIINNVFDYQKNFDKSIIYFVSTLFATCVLYWVQRWSETKSPVSSATKKEKLHYWWYAFTFIAYVAFLLATSGFLVYFVAILTMLCPQLSIILIIIQRLLLSTIYKDEKESDRVFGKSWSGWSIPLLPFLVLLIPMDQKQLNRHISITNITF